MRTALYLWVSTAQQKPDLQADGVHRYAKRAGSDIVAEHMDVAVSGRQEGRPLVQALRRPAQLPCRRAGRGCLRTGAEV
jgi:DNA invertase Pin-like site-specific DNA recombinase